MGCIFQIKEGINSFTNTEKKLAEYILANKEDVINMSAQELAKEADISPAAVVRFSKRLGYKGFTTFKVELAKDKDYAKEKLSIIIESKDSTDIIVKKIGAANSNIIAETLKLVNTQTLDEAIEAILKGKSIYLFGIGASGLVAMDLQYKLLRINKSAIYQNDTHIQLASAIHIGSDDVAIGISYSGESKEVNIAIKKAKENGAKVIAITKYNKSTLSKMADIVLYTPNEEKELRLGAISSRIAALTLIDILFLGIAKENFNKTENYLIETRNIVQQLK